MDTMTQKKPTWRLVKSADYTSIWNLERKNWIGMWRYETCFSADDLFEAVDKAEKYIHPMIYYVE